MKKIKLEISPAMILAVIVLLAIGFGAGYLLPKAAQAPEVGQTQFSLSEKDLNTLGNIIGYSGYYFGHCERLGLVASVYVQQDQNGNVYGLPICVEQKQQAAGQ